MGRGEEFAALANLNSTCCVASHPLLCPQAAIRNARSRLQAASDCFNVFSLDPGCSIPERMSLINLKQLPVIHTGCRPLRAAPFVGNLP